MSDQRRLSEKSIRVLSLIADGHSYGQIVDGHQDTVSTSALSDPLSAREAQSEPWHGNTRRAEVTAKKWRAEK